MRYVLIVEDDPLIRQNLANYLIEAGFGVMEAETGDEAVNLLAPSASTSFSVTFTCRGGRTATKWG